MHVAERQHRPEHLLSLVGEATLGVPGRRVVVGAEEHVPPDDVAVVVPVLVLFVVDAVHLGALEDVTNPPRRADVGVIEELTESATRRVHSAGGGIEPQQRVDDEAAEHRVRDHLERVLVEARDHLETPRAVVNLVEAAP